MFEQYDWLRKITKNFGKVIFISNFLFFLFLFILNFLFFIFIFFNFTFLIFIFFYNRLVTEHGKEQLGDFREIVMNVFNAINYESKTISTVIDLIGNDIYNSHNILIKELSKKKKKLKIKKLKIKKKKFRKRKSCEDKEVWFVYFYCFKFKLKGLGLF